jgi:hypothetical protein
LLNIFFILLLGKNKHNTSLQGNKATSQMQEVKQETTNMKQLPIDLPPFHYWV